MINGNNRIMKIIIFGLGRYYKNREKEILDLLKNDEIVAFTDNDCRTAGKERCQPFYIPEQAVKIEFDRIVITTYRHYLEIYNQLRRLSVPEEKIVYLQEFFIKRQNQELIVYQGDSGKKRSVLMISSRLGFDGAPMALYNLARVLQKLAYNVCILSESGDEKYFQMVKAQGMEVWIYSGLSYLLPEEIYKKHFDIVFVNTVVMINSVVKMSKLSNVIWWIHEGADMFTGNYTKSKILVPEQKYDWLDSVRIYAVSNRAKNNFIDFYPTAKVGIWPVGIPDRNTETINGTYDKWITLAIIGSVYPLKGQDVLIEAICNLDENIRRKYRTWVIGEYDDKSDYTKKLLEKTRSMSQVKMFGALTIEELYKVYPLVDVIVCASREETLSLAIVEGMMFGKICITTDATGIADYIDNGKNGFIVPAGNVAALIECLEYIEKHREECMIIANEGRKTYEKCFSIEAFEERTKDVLKKLEDRLS